MTPEPVRVILADDHTLVRGGIRRILESQPGVDVVAEAADGREAIEACAAHEPDVLVLDLKMPGVDGIDVLEHDTRADITIVDGRVAFDRHQEAG